MSVISLNEFSFAKLGQGNIHASNSTPIHGRMAIASGFMPNGEVDPLAENLGEPHMRVVAHEVPVGDWLEIIYV